MGEHDEPLARQLVDAHAALEERLGARLDEHQRALLASVERLLRGHRRPQSDLEPRGLRRPNSAGSAGGLGSPRPAVGKLHQSAQLHSSGRTQDDSPASGKRRSSPDDSPASGKRRSQATSADPDSSSSLPPGRGERTAATTDLRSFGKFGLSSLTSGAVWAGTLSTQDSHLNRTRDRIMTGEFGYHSTERGPLISIIACRLKESRAFQFAVGAVILTNAVSIGFSAEWVIKHPGVDRPGHFNVLDWICMILFILEVCVRLTAERLTFFAPRNRNVGWNLFDVSLIALSFLIQLASLDVSVYVVRVFRVLRLVRVVKTLRLLKQFRELRVMVSGILSCGRTLLWAAVLLTMVTYTYAVFCMEVIAHWLPSPGATSEGTDRETVDFVVGNFSSVFLSCYTLFKALSGGMNWGQVATPLERVDKLLLYSFPVYIGVTVFCILNVVTAAFLDAATRHTQEEDAHMLDHIETRLKWIEGVKAIFQRHDRGETGSLTWEEFESGLNDPYTQELFREFGIDMEYQASWLIFRLFDQDGNGSVDINEFAQGIFHFSGTARSLDMFRQFTTLDKKLQAVLDHTQSLEQSLEALACSRPALDRTRSLEALASKDGLCREHSV